jgi:hypothetical protein
VPGDDARDKQLREIQQLLLSPPVLVHVPRAGSGGDDSDAGAGEKTEPHLISTIPVDEMLDDHATEFEECRRWASSDAGQIARAQNPAGFANVHAHAAEHAAAMARQQLRAALISGGTGATNSRQAQGANSSATGGTGNATGK